jgi:hypothetical protein
MQEQPNTLKIELYEDQYDKRQGHADVQIRTKDGDNTVVGSITVRIYIRSASATIQDIRATAIEAAQYYLRNAQLPSQSENRPERLAQLWFL